MSYQSEFVDFEAISIREGLRQSCLTDHWSDFAGIDGYARRGAFDGSMHAFNAARKETHAFRFNLAAVVEPGHPALLNLTEQGKFFRENEQGCRELLTANGLKLGQVLPTPKDDGDLAANANPYHSNFKGDDREVAIARLIKSGGTKLAASLAKSAGCDIAGRPLRS